MSLRTASLTASLSRASGLAPLRRAVMSCFFLPVCFSEENSSSASELLRAGFLSSSSDEYLLETSANRSFFFSFFLFSSNLSQVFYLTLNFSSGSRPLERPVYLFCVPYFLFAPTLSPALLLIDCPEFHLELSPCLNHLITCEKEQKGSNTRKNSRPNIFHFTSDRLS